MSSNLPIGWEDRNNQMSEHDLKLGGDAANKFAAKSASVYHQQQQDGLRVEYQNSEQVKAFYMKKIEQEEKQSNSATSTSTTTPMGWESRQAQRAVQAKQFGVFSSKNGGISTANTDIQASSSNDDNNNKKGTNTEQRRPPEALLVDVATHSLNAMSEALTQNPTIAFSAEERAAFAQAMQRAMQAIANCR